MKKMEKTAGEKEGKDAAIRKDSETSAEKIVIPHTSLKGSEQKRADKSETDEHKIPDIIKKTAGPENDVKDKRGSQNVPTVKGKGLKSAVEGKNSDPQLPTDDDGTIVL